LYAQNRRQQLGGNRQNRQTQVTERLDQRRDVSTDRSRTVNRNTNVSRSANVSRNASGYYGGQGGYYGGGGYYYPPAGGYYGYDHWDDGEVALLGLGAAAVGAMAGYAAGESNASNSYSPAPSTPVAPPCSASPVVVKGVTYYPCGSTWYSQGYSANGPVYTPVAPPEGY
jgi:hypothetical protein